MSLSRLARQAGVSKSTLIRWEAGENRPCRFELDSVLTALDASPEQRRGVYARLDAPRGRAGLCGLSEDAPALPTVGDLLRAMRLRRGLRLEQLAASLRVSPSTVSRWERGGVAPPPDLRELLFDALNARPEERAALLDRRVLLGPGDGPPPTLEEIGQSLADLFGQMQQGRHGLMDLTFFLLRSRLWPYLARGEGAGETLAQLHLVYALGLTWVDRRTEAARHAEQSLELWRASGGEVEGQINAVIISALMNARSGNRQGPGRAVELLRNILPLAPSPLWVSAIYRDMADYAGRDGGTEAALGFIGLAREAADRAEDEAAVRLAQYVHVQVLLDAGRARSALPLLQESRTSPVQRILEAQQGVAALVEVGETAEARRWAVRADTLLARYDYPHLRRRMGELVKYL